ncbi:glycoside hydrolase family 32 protein [Pendulispora rubella]|uniref:Glycoside hydrolase family 32 protein n=1 Tax=Pendulispora rubella TaxID=2741070 RepID=A0ABZ2L493_9BACT
MQRVLTFLAVIACIGISRFASGQAAPGYYDETYRPQYHFSAETSWINDPNGLVHYQGEYHLFYQYHPLGIAWGPMHWGHAVSPDMVQWTHLPIALYPDALGDIWSGSAVVDENNTSGFFTHTGGSGLVALFTHANAPQHPQQQSVAYSTDRGRTWTKYPGNPVIPNPGVADFRDPKVFWHAPTARWVMVVAGGQLRIYSSPNLTNWTLESIAPTIDTECPDLFELAVDGGATKKWVLSKSGREYLVGRFDGRTFTPEGGPYPVDYGPDFYAAQSWSHMPDGRRVWIGWMRGDAGSKQTVFMGRMSLPRELTLRTFPEGVRMVQAPIAELQGHRAAGTARGTTILRSGTRTVSGLGGDSFEIRAEFQANASTASEFGLRVRMGNGQYTTVGYRRTAARLFVDKDHGGGGYTGVHEAPLVPDGNGRIVMHLYVDRSSLEVFGNDGKVTLTELSYPDRDSVGLELYSVGGDATLNALQFFRMKKVWGPSPFITGLSGWRDVKGDWGDTMYGRQGRSGGDGFSLSSTTGGDFTYEGNIRVLGGYAGALVFRSDSEGANAYIANIDVGNQGVKLFKLVRGAFTDLGWFPTALQYNTTYHLKVVARGANIKVYLGNNLVHDLNDSSHTSGYFGLNVFNGTAAVQNVVTAP